MLKKWTQRSFNFRDSTSKDGKNMEKITFDRKIDILIMVSSLFVVLFVSYFFLNLSTKIILLLSVFSFLFFPTVMFFEYLEYREIYFSKKALIIRNKIINWEELEIEPMTKNENYFILKIKNNQNKKQIVFKYNTIKSFVLLTLKYCPHEHELYKAVQEYAKVNNIPF